MEATTELKCEKSAISNIVEHQPFILNLNLSEKDQKPPTNGHDSDSQLNYFSKTIQIGTAIPQVNQTQT